MSEHKSLTEQEITDACRHMREQLAAPFVDKDGVVNDGKGPLLLPTNSLVHPCFAAGQTREQWNKEHDIKPWTRWDEIKYRVRNIWHALRGDQLFH